MVAVNTNKLKHSITFRISPSKPQVICTPRRCAMIDPFEITTRGLSIVHSQTPPPIPVSSGSVVGLGIEPVVDRNYDKAYERIKARPTWTQTPPNLNSLSTATVRRVASDINPLVKATNPTPTAPDQTQLSEVTSWIIMELEASIASSPEINLQLDSPVILQICLVAGQRRVPRITVPLLPLSRYSNFDGPLPSHPTHSSFNAHLQAATPPSSPTPPTNLRSLSIIFPHASPQLLSSLQAIYLALHYISDIHLPSPSSTFPPVSCTETISPLSPNMPYVPAKARAMLGLQTPTTRPDLPASCTRAEIREWRERIKTLECKLRREVMRFVRMCEGSDSNEALVRAIGQIVDFGQVNARRSS